MLYKYSLFLIADLYFLFYLINSYNVLYKIPVLFSPCGSGDGEERRQSFRGLPTWGDLPLALQTADQSLNVLKLVYGILHRGLWGQ